MWDQRDLSTDGSGRRRLSPRFQKLEEPRTQPIQGDRISAYRFADSPEFLGYLTLTVNGLAVGPEEPETTLESQFFSIDRAGNFSDGNGNFVLANWQNGMRLYVGASPDSNQRWNITTSTRAGRPVSTILFSDRSAGLKPYELVVDAHGQAVLLPESQAQKEFPTGFTTHQYPSPPIPIGPPAPGPGSGGSLVEIVGIGLGIGLALSAGVLAASRLARE